ncbi:SDR family NAD(P)-dependent oxidoreductase [Chloroflexota bacterium]
MGNRLQGKVAIVTGAGRGIGRAEALALASEGAKVVVNDIGGAVDGSGASKSPADEVVDEINNSDGTAVSSYDSVSTAEGGERIVKTAVDAFGKLDILVNNAGILRDAMVFNMTEEQWDLVLKVHLYGHFHTIRPASVLFRDQRSGRIINTSSNAGLGHTFGQANYGAAKEGIVGLTRKVAQDLGKYGVTCNTIRPGAGTRMLLTDDLVHTLRRMGKEDAIDEMNKMKPDDIAPLVVWLASDAASNVNGRTFYIKTGVVGLYSEPMVEKQILKIGGWTIDEMFEFLPKTITADLVNPHLPKPVAD